MQQNVWHHLWIIKEKNQLKGQPLERRTRTGEEGLFFLPTGKWWYVIIQMQMSVDSTVRWLEKNLNVYPMQMHFITKQNVQGLPEAGREKGAASLEDWARRMRCSGVLNRSQERGQVKTQFLRKKNLSYIWLRTGCLMNFTAKTEMNIKKASVNLEPLCQN